ncbi:MAG: hypothetical protein PHQ47_00510 [Candidatus Portnoybacteria bacterium]|nr:hypothetical protein [Candidatus Portnoybacteria bacterium]
MLQNLVFFGAAIQLGGALIYVKETLAGYAKPNKITFLMWSIAPFIAATAAFANGARWVILPIFMAGFGPLLVFIVSFKNPKSFWKLNLFDYLCGIFSLLALILWMITREPAVAIFFAIISDLFAAIPTLIKSWKFPETESHWIYTTSIFGPLTGLLAIKQWQFSEYAFSIYLLAIDCALAFFVIRKSIINLFKSQK